MSLSGPTQQFNPDDKIVSLHPISKGLHFYILEVVDDKGKVSVAFVFRVHCGM